MEKLIGYKITDNCVLGLIKKNTNKSYLYYHALATEKNMVTRVKKSLCEYNITLHKHNKKDQWKQKNTSQSFINFTTNIWVGETEEQMAIERVIKVALLPTYPLILKTVHLNDRILSIEYNNNPLIIDQNIPKDAFLETLPKITGQKILLINQNPLVIIYEKNVDTGNE